MLMALVVLLAGTAGALAHASLLSSTPVADEVLAQAPAAEGAFFRVPRILGEEP
jgi:methionine-rich copper-binding protein CopC